MPERHEWDIDFEEAPRRGAAPIWRAPEPTGWAEPRVTRAVDVFWKGVWRTLGAVLAVALTVAAFGVLWLFSAILTG